MSYELTLPLKMLYQDKLNTFRVFLGQRSASVNQASLGRVNGKFSFYGYLL
jgi:hypothetical protein